MSFQESEKTIKLKIVNRDTRSFCNSRMDGHSFFSESIILRSLVKEDRENIRNGFFLFFNLPTPDRTCPRSRGVFWAVFVDCAKLPMYKPRGLEHVR